MNQHNPRPMTPHHWNPLDGPPPIGKYSQLSSVPPGSCLVFIAGQVGNDTDGTLLDDAYDQTVAALRNIETLLATMGCGPRHLVRLLTFVSGTANLPGFYRGRDTVYERWFDDGVYPGHSLAVVAALAQPGLHVEIEGWAAVPEHSLTGGGDTR